MSTNRLTLLFLSLPLMCAVVAPAMAITYTTIVYPGSFETDAFGISGPNIVGGYYVDSVHGSHGFEFDGITWTTLDEPLATGGLTLPLGISGNEIFGSYSTDLTFSTSHGFLYDGTTRTTLDFPGSTFNQVTGISGANIVGIYANAPGDWHGYLYNGTTWTTIDPPGSNTTLLAGIEGNKIIGTYLDGFNTYRNFVYDGTIFKPLDLNALGFVHGISGGRIVGEDDGGSNIYGFLYDGTTYSLLSDPLGVNGTVATGIDGNHIVGVYADDANAIQSFVATVPEPASIALLLVGMASYGGALRRFVGRLS